MFGLWKRICRLKMQLGRVVGSSIQTQGGGNESERGRNSSGHRGRIGSVCRECSVFLYFILYFKKGGRRSGLLINNIR